MKKLQAFFLILIIFCATACNQSKVEETENSVFEETDKEQPFSLEGYRHEFDYKETKHYRMGYIYVFHATITNGTDKKITKADTKIKTGSETKWGLFGEYESDTFNEAIAKVVFQDKTMYAREEVLFALGGGEFKDNNIDNIERLRDVSTERPWNPGEKRRIKIVLSFEELRAIHFEYEPKSCIISIPFTVEDPTGYTYTTYFNYDISDDWAQYARKDNKETIDSIVAEEEDKGVEIEVSEEFGYELQATETDN